METLKSIAVWVTAILAIIIIAVSIFLAVSILTDLPQSPTLVINGSEAEQVAKGKEISNYKDLTSALLAQRTNAFDIVITKTLLPILTTLITAVISYIFAKAGVQLYTAYLNSKK